MHQKEPNKKYVIKIANLPRRATNDQFTLFLNKRLKDLKYDKIAVE